MNEQNQSEKQLQSWTLRRPSAEIRARLFPQAERPSRSSYQRRAEILSWLTPVTACVLTFVAAWGGSNRHSMIYDNRDNTSYSTTISMHNSSNSNSQREFLLSSSDVNLQWNVWPSAHSERVTNFSAPSSSLESWSAPTNHQ